MLTDVIEIEAVADEWDELADRSGATPFLRPGWFVAWSRAFGGGDLNVITLRRHGRLAAVLPAQAKGGLLRSATNDHTIHFGVLAEDSGATGELYDALFQRRHRRIRLEYAAREQAGFDEFFEAAERTGYSVRSQRMLRSPYVAIDGDWPTFTKRLPRKSLLADLRRRRRRLDEQGEVTVEVSDGTERLHQLLAEGFRIEGSGWKETQGSAIESRPEYQVFYTCLAEWGVERDLLRLAFLRLDGKPLAFALGLQDDSAYYYVKGGYDTSFSFYAPGKLMTQALLMRAFDMGLSSYEMLGADEPWKLQWTSACRERVLLEAVSGSPFALLERGARAGRRRLAGLR